MGAKSAKSDPAFLHPDPSTTPVTVGLWGRVESKTGHFELRDPSKCVANDLFFCLNLSGLIEMLPATTAAGSENRTKRIGSPGARRQQLDSLGVNKARLRATRPDL